MEIIKMNYPANHSFIRLQAGISVGSPGRSLREGCGLLLQFPLGEADIDSTLVKDSLSGGVSLNGPISGVFAFAPKIKVQIHRYNGNRTGLEHRNDLFAGVNS